MNNKNGRAGEHDSDNAKAVFATLDDIREDIDSMKRHIADLAEDIKNAGADEARDALHLLRKGADTVKHSGEEAIGKIEGGIKSSPRRSIAVAFAMGALAALFIGRRSS
jgi:ElaB/YqjD/DUF883 family membrane-anchored ribosome-binding protein